MQGEGNYIAVSLVVYYDTLKCLLKLILSPLLLLKITKIVDESKWVYFNIALILFTFEDKCCTCFKKWVNFIVASE